MTHDSRRIGTTMLFTASTSSTAPSSAPTCSANGTRSSSASSIPSTRRCQHEKRPKPSSTTTPLTSISIRECANGSPGIPAGHSTSPQPWHPGPTQSKASSPSSPDAASSRGVFRSVDDLQAAISRFVGRPTPTPNPSCGPPIQKRSRGCQTREGEVKVAPLAACRT